MDVFPCGMCIYSKKCPCRTILAFLALLKKILRLPLWHGTKTERKDYIPVYLSLGGRPRERYTEEERQLLRDIAQLKGTLQRLNNYFGGRQYREVFEENRALITELKKILSR